MKATGIVRRIDDLGRVVIPKEIRRTLRIREGDPLQTALTQWEKFCFAMDDLAKRLGADLVHNAGTSGNPTAVFREEKQSEEANTGNNCL